MEKTVNTQRFVDRLEMEYTFLFGHDIEYAYVKNRTTPKALAEKMTNGLLNRSANKDGEGIKRTCKALSIKYTFKAIQEFCGNKN